MLIIIPSLFLSPGLWVCKRTVQVEKVDDINKVSAGLFHSYITKFLLLCTFMGGGTSQVSFMIFFLFTLLMNR